MAIQFDDVTAIKMKLFYQEEYARTLHKLNELKSILDQMEGIEVDQTLPQNLSGQQKLATPKKVLNSEKPKRKKRKKNSIRSEWSKFILSRLRATRQPLSYDDMVNHAIAIKNLDKTEFDTLRKKIISAAFSLRTQHNKIDTYAIKGSRTKYMGLNDWFEKEGYLKKEFAEKI